MSRYMTHKSTRDGKAQTQHRNMIRAIKSGATSVTRSGRARIASEPRTASDPYADTLSDSASLSGPYSAFDAR